MFCKVKSECPLPTESWLDGAAPTPLCTGFCTRSASLPRSRCREQELQQIALCAQPGESPWPSVTPRCEPGPGQGQGWGFSNTAGS